MSLKLKVLREQTIVITGASSGIGLATAQMAAKRGANVVLVARNRAVLDEAAREINDQGGHAIAVDADVADREALQAAAEATIQRFGRIDTWINDASVGIVGRLEDVSEDDARRMFDTNFWGMVHGCMVALPYMKRSGGALINVGSVESDIAVPLQGMYSASKHAVKGYTDALRLELHDEGAPVSVTLIKPSAINTEFMHHARNYLDREPKLPPPVYEPEDVAYAICHAAEHPRRDIIVGGAGLMMSSLGANAPSAMDTMNKAFTIRQQRRAEPPIHPQGTLFESGSNGVVRGDEPGPVIPFSIYTRAALRPLATGAVILAAGLATAAWIGRDALRERFKLL